MSCCRSGSAPHDLSSSDKLGWASAQWGVSGSRGSNSRSCKTSWNLYSEMHTASLSPHSVGQSKSQGSPDLRALFSRRKRLYHGAQARSGLQDGIRNFTQTENSLRSPGAGNRDGGYGKRQANLKRVSGIAGVLLWVPWVPWNVGICPIISTNTRENKVCLEDY